MTGISFPSGPAEGASPTDRTHSTSQAAAKKTLEGSPKGKFESHDISKMSEEDLDKFINHLDSQINELDQRIEHSDHLLDDIFDAKDQAVIQEFGNIEKGYSSLLSQLKGKKEFVTTTKDTATEGHAIREDKPPVTPRETHVTQNLPNQKEAVQTNTISQHVFIPPQPKGPPPSPTQAYRPPEPTTPPPSPPTQAYRPPQPTTPPPSPPTQAYRPPEPAGPYPYSSTELPPEPKGPYPFSPIPQRPAGPTPLIRTPLSKAEQHPLQAPQTFQPAAPTMPRTSVSISQTPKPATKATSPRPQVENELQMGRIKDPKVADAYRKMDVLLQNANVSNNSETRKTFLGELNKLGEGLSSSQKKSLTKLIIAKHNDLERTLEEYNKGGLKDKSQMIQGNCNEMWALRMTTIQLGTKNQLKSASKPTSQTTLENAYRKASESLMESHPLTFPDVTQFNLDKEGKTLAALKEFETTSETFAKEMDSLSGLLDTNGELKPEVKEHLMKTISPKGTALKAIKDIQSRIAALKVCANSGREVAKSFAELNSRVNDVNITKENQRAQVASSGLRDILNSDAYKKHLRDLSHYTVNYTRVPPEASLNAFLTQPGQGMKEQVIMGIKKERPAMLGENMGLTLQNLNDYLIMPTQRGTRFEMGIKEFSKQMKDTEGSNLSETLLQSTSSRNQLTNQIQTLRDAA